MWRQTSAGWGKRAIFEQNASISLARWRWRLLRYFKQVVNLSATCFHVEMEQFSFFGMLSRRASLSALAGLSCVTYYQLLYIFFFYIYRLSVTSHYCRIYDQITEPQFSNFQSLQTANYAGSRPHSYHASAFIHECNARYWYFRPSVCPSHTMVGLLWK